MVRIVLLRLLESYFRHPILYLLPMLIALLAGLGSIAIEKPEYIASGRLYVEKESLLAALTSNTNDGSWWVSGAQSTTTEINELLGTKAFVRSAIQKTKLEAGMSAGPEAIDKTIFAFRQSISINPVGEKLVDISATSDDPELAYQIVIATLDAYVQWKINTEYQESVAARAFFDGLVQPYQDQVEVARADLLDFLDEYPEPVRGEREPVEQLELDRLQAALQQAEERLSTTLENQENANLSLAESESVTRQTYLVIDQPELPREPEISLRSLVQNVAIFVAVGIFLSALGIGGGALLDRSYRFPIDVRNSLSLPVLAMVPRASVADMRAATSVATKGAVEERSGSETSIAQPSAIGNSRTGD